MSDVLARTEPVPAEAFSGHGATISLGPISARYSLRARDVAEIEALTERTAPARIGSFDGDMACLGPDEWLWRPATGRTFRPLDAPVAVVDVSERSICLIVEGPRAVTVLKAGCPLDLERFLVGRATRTLYETVEIILFHEAEDRWQIEVWRSFAPWLWQALSTAASD